MLSPTETFTLRSTLTSPFGRKVRMAVDVLGLSDRITIIPADTLDETDTLRQQNPLGKLPCLLLADETVLYDSRVIIEFLQELTGSSHLVPPRGVERYTTLSRAVLADGITDAGLLMVYEGRFREPATFSERWLKHQRGKIARALATFEAAPPPPNKTNIVSISLTCALGYLDWRKPVAWREDHPRLVSWLAAYTAFEPAVERTRIPAP